MKENKKRGLAIAAAIAIAGAGLAGGATAANAALPVWVKTGGTVASFDGVTTTARAELAATEAGVLTVRQNASSKAVDAYTRDLAKKGYSKPVLQTTAKATWKAGSSSKSMSCETTAKNSSKVCVGATRLPAAGTTVTVTATTKLTAIKSGKRVAVKSYTKTWTKAVPALPSAPAPQKP